MVPMECSQRGFEHKPDPLPNGAPSESRKRVGVSDHAFASNASFSAPVASILENGLREPRSQDFAQFLGEACDCGRNHCASERAGKRRSESASRESDS